MCSLLLSGVQKIQQLADEIDRLTPLVAQAAIRVRREPSNAEAREELDSRRMEWAKTVKELTNAVDVIINPEDFTAVSGLYVLVFNSIM